MLKAISIVHDMMPLTLELLAILHGLASRVGDVPCFVSVIELASVCFNGGDQLGGHSGLHLVNSPCRFIMT